MLKPLITIIPADKKDALCNGGVLPVSWFKDVGDSSSNWNTDDSCVHLWTNELKYDIKDSGGIPPHPAQLLGLDDSVSSEYKIVAKFFNAWILHIVFLDKISDSGEGANPWVGVDQILKVARWARDFNKSIKYWFADEQACNIKQGIVVIASDGLVKLTTEQIILLRKEFSEESFLQTCYFLDFRLEPELDCQVFHSKYLWPILTGRLLLRLLIALSENLRDDVLLPGVHLWRSFEFLFDYPIKEMSEMLSKKLNEMYQLLSKETDSSLSKNSFVGNSSFKDGANQLNIFSEIPNSLTEFFNNGQESKEKDNSKQKSNEECFPSYPLERIVEEKTNNDEKYWGECLEKAREDFVDREVKLLRKESLTAKCYSSYTVFSSVASDPHNVSIWMRKIKDEMPSNALSKNDIYSQWIKVIEAEDARQKEKIRLRKAGEELSLAQAHYVTPGYCAVAAVAVSLFCGLTLFLFLNSIFDKALMSLCFASLSVAGAFGAWGIFSNFHRRAGKKAVNQFRNVAKKVDDAMNDRHSAAVTVMRTAEEQHRTRITRDVWQALYRLLERNWSILTKELQSPTLSAFYRTEDEKADNVSKTDKQTEKCRQCQDFLSMTRFVDPINGGFLPDEHKQSDKVLDEALNQVSGENSFVSFWHQICDSVDEYHQGNIPAKEIIPKIRCWILDLCNKLSVAQKSDLLSARNKDKPLPSQFEKIRTDVNYFLATAHVDEPYVKQTQERVFVFQDESNSNAIDYANEIIESRLDITADAVPIMNGLPQVAFYFQDIRLYGFWREGDGRLLFQTEYQS